MSGVHVAIPSFNRVGKVRALAAFPDAFLWVPEGQAEAYGREYGDERVIAVPDRADGSLPRKLNYLLEHSPSRWLLRVDDDVYGVGVWERDEWRELDSAEIAALVDQGFRLCEEVGTALWGINILKDKRAYSVHRPFKLLAPVRGPFNGHVLDHGLRYDERMGAKEDVDFFLQVIAKYRRAFRLDKYHFLKKDETVGGCYASRTWDREKAWAEALERKWGSRIIDFGPKRNLLDGRTNVPIQGC